MPDNAGDTAVTGWWGQESGQKDTGPSSVKERKSQKEEPKQACSSGGLWGPPSVVRAGVPENGLG